MSGMNSLDFMAQITNTRSNKVFSIVLFASLLIFAYVIYNLRALTVTLRGAIYLIGSFMRQKHKPLKDPKEF
jgi:hypothetical protein